jgi:hypothetical protein
MKMIEIVLSKAAAVSYCPFKVCFSHYASKKNHYKTLIFTTFSSDEKICVKNKSSCF